VAENDSRKSKTPKGGQLRDQGRGSLVMAHSQKKFWFGVLGGGELFFTRKRREKSDLAPPKSPSLTKKGWN